MIFLSFCVIIFEERNIFFSFLKRSENKIYFFLHVTKYFPKRADPDIFLEVNLILKIAVFKKLYNLSFLIYIFLKFYADKLLQKIIHFIILHLYIPQIFMQINFFKKLFFFRILCILFLQIITFF